MLDVVKEFLVDCSVYLHQCEPNRASWYVAARVAT